MTLPTQSAVNTGSQRVGYEGGLARSLVRTLLVFTFIPLMLMAGAAYLRARTLLREQAVSQMQAQLTNQLGQVNLAIKTKEIRLDRLVRSPDFANAIATASRITPDSEEFRSLRDEVTRQIRALNPEVGRATFNQYFLMKPDGTIQFASKPEWDGVSLHSASFYQALKDSDHQSAALYDPAPLYPGQLVLLTVVQYRSPDGAQAGSLVGITESQELQNILQNLVKLNSAAEAYFVTENGSLIGTDPYTTQLSVIQPSAFQKNLIMAALNEAMKDESGLPQSIEYSDQGGISALSQVIWLSTMHAGIVYEIHQNAIFDSLNSLIPFTVAIFLISLVAMGMVLSLGASRVFRPLVNLAEITRRFSGGDFSQRAEARSRDEIGLLAQSFNQMAEELSNLYNSLEQKVDERTRQIRTAAEVAQRITSTTNLNELLNRTVQLIVQQFSFYEASIFMLDRGGKFAVLRASYGPAAEEMLARGHRLEAGSASIIGWVTANNQPRIASNVTEDPFHLRNELLPETRSEAGIPISVGNLVLGALDVQSTAAGAFGPETIVMLQILANQIAIAIQNVGLVESTQVNFQELERLHRASHQIAAAQSKSEALQTARRLLNDGPYPSLVISVNDHRLQIEGASDPSNEETVRVQTAVRNLEAGLDEVEKFLSGSPVIAEATSFSLPAPFAQFSRGMNHQSTAFLPIVSRNRLMGLITLGGPRQTLTSAMVQPYANMADLVGTTLDKIAENEEKERQLLEREALASINQAIAESSSEMDKFFGELHAQVQQNIGEFAFVVALYDKATETINIPYTYEDGRVDKIEAFPLGEGLSSILIRTGRPLLLVEDVERRALELGAKNVGRPARSWMGAPMMIHSEPIGALIVQDLDHEHAFNEGNLNFFVALANQVAAVIHNARLLDESRARAFQLETAAEIARDISGLLNLDELLAKAVNFIRERFNFYHASIFLLDLPGEFAIIREATGEAGAQMKRVGHRLGVGSKSIVGYVSGRGERLVVNDTAKDATYYANPLLPNTCSEAALPLKVGERIVGVMDVQSAHPYAFTDDNLRTLQILADQLAVAVINSELFAETQEHLSQHRLLHHITTSAASGTTLEEALESAVTGLQVTLGGDRVAIMLADREKKHLDVRAAVGYSAEVMHLRVPIGTGITGWAAAHRRSLRVDNVADDPRYIQGSSNTKSELAVPLIYRNELLGVLNVESEQTSAYTENDEEMLGTLGGSLAAIIANARLLEQLRAQAERERALYEITNKIRRSNDMQAILATTASELTKAVGARRTQISISTEGKNGDTETGRRAPEDR